MKSTDRTKAPFEPLAPGELVRLRGDLSFSQVELAAELEVPESQVVAWEDGSLPVPRRTATRIRYQAAAARRDRAFEDAGLPVCDWVAEWQRELSSASGKVEKKIERLKEHTATCERCQARETFAKTLPEMPPPPPAEGLLGVYVRFMDWAETLPEWLRPAVIGGVGFGAMTVFRNIFFIGNPASWPKLAAATALATFGAACLGLLGGFVYRWMKRVAPTAGLPALFAIGLAGAQALMTVSVGAVLALTGPQYLLDRATWIVDAIAVVPFGILFAVWLRREQRTAQRAT